MKKRGLILGHEIGVNRGMREFKVERRIYLNREWDLILSGKLEDDGDIKVRLDLFSKVYKTVAKKKGLTLRNAEIEKLVKNLREIYMKLNTARDKYENRKD